ncbi:GDSL esterase/lipase [Hibiscus syriacus]|uniref:GDSL esterase/lipase n=1 Tax=Hibiscus syriacus TaxID=106335 RepID=A0A6A2ZNV0_HIBSY|nr:GDSL esterase/lipase [Hibiscus syriacus]
MLECKLNMASKVVVLFFYANLLLQVLETRATVPVIIVFGDSTVDPGNNEEETTVLKSNFEPYGRDYHGGQPTGCFSNGRIATNFISEAFGIKPAIRAYREPKFGIKDFTTGVSFASAGRGYDNVTSDVMFVLPFWMELEHYKEYQDKLRGYLGKDEARHRLAESLHLISIGTNDFLDNYYISPIRFLTRKVSIGGLPPMGCLPLERTRNMLSGRECIDEYNNVAKDFNKKLEGAVTELKQELHGIHLVMSNPYDKLMEMIHNPSHFGFEEAEAACCGTGFFEISYLCGHMNPFTCSDANKYVFWDAFHPTEKTRHFSRLYGQDYPSRVPIITKTKRKKHYFIVAGGVLTRNGSSTSSTRDLPNKILSFPSQLTRFLLLES